ncbi:hypothetical protein PMAYCL1PPCAC_21914, partial [Pristionchus mayeri]
QLQGQFFECSSCDARFYELNLMYTHWNTSVTCSGQMRVTDPRGSGVVPYLRNNALPKLPKLIDEKKQVVTYRIRVPALKDTKINCTESSCDFECDSVEEIQKHAEAIHCHKYMHWKAMGRLHRLFAGSLCPYCTFPVSDVGTFLSHVKLLHPTSAQPEMAIFSCASCDSRFNRLHLVYEHWHQNEACKGHIIIDNPNLEDTVVDRPEMRGQPRLPRILYRKRSIGYNINKTGM